MVLFNLISECINFITPISIFISSLYFTFYCQKKTSDKKNIENYTLPDILHTDSLNYHKYYKWGDVSLQICILSLFYFNEYIDKFLILMSMIYIIRGISFSITILPKCGKMIDKDNTRSCTQIFIDYATLKDNHTGHNNDLLFSGHVSFMFLFCLYITYFYKLYENSMIIFLSYWLLLFVSSIGVIITRCHYSIDVLYAYITTFFVFQNVVLIMGW